MSDESIPILTHEQNFLTFWEEAKEDGLATTKAGRAMFSSVLKLRIQTPGDNKATAEYEVETVYPEGYPNPVYGKVKKNEAIYKRFGKYIDEHKARQSGPGQVTGTPIEHWPMVNRAQVAMLKHNQIYNVESLAMLSDVNLAALGMEGRKFVQQAKDWLQQAKNASAAMEAQERERKMEERFAALESQYRELAEAMEALPEDSQKMVAAAISKRGRKSAA